LSFQPLNFPLSSIHASCHSARPHHRILKNYLQLNVGLLYWILIAPFAGQFFKIAPIFRQMVFIGVRAAPMVALTAFSVGVTLAMQAAHSLQQLGAEIYVPDLVMVTLVPRFLAMLVMLPALTIMGNYIGVFGGWAVCTLALDFNTAGYVLRALQSADTWDLYSGMIKSAVFAWIVITIACNAGLHVEGGAEGVGQATTASVVQALLAMLVTNAVLTGIFFFGA
jgi:phospholipid/cholesterol/gamma-HCH transport system permease protein